MAGLRLADMPRIHGTNVRSRYLETSVGCLAIDALMGGGGIPVSSIYLIDEDRSRLYATILSKYFIAEGVCCDHSLFVASTSRKPSKLLEDLPDRIAAIPEDPAVEDDGRNEEDQAMKIAWRYATAPKMASSLVGNRSSATAQFDLTKKMDQKKVEACDITLFNNSINSSNDLLSYEDLYRQIRQKLAADEFQISSSKSPKRILRIVIEGVGGPLWLDPQNDLKFVVHLRSILCSSYAVAMLIVNSSGMSDERKKRLYTYGELVIHLEAVDSDVTTVQKFNDNFDGYFRLLKLPAVASIATYCPASSDLIFQLQKRKFDIRILHLPPAIDDDSKKVAESNCQKMLNF